MNFELELAQPNIKSYKIITLFMAFLNAVSLIFYFLNSNTGFLKAISLTGVAASAFLTFFIFFKLGKSAKAFKWVAILLLIMAACWVLLGNFYFFFLFLLLAYFSFIALQPPLIKVNEAGIKYPSFPAKNYDWQQVHQVLIKDDVLSIDLKDNKFIQFLLPPTSVLKIKVLDFNNFCKKQILENSIPNK